MSSRGKWFVGLVTVLGTVLLTTALANWESPDLIRFGAFLAVALAICGLQLTVPGSAAALPLNIVFLLIAIVDFTLPEALLLSLLIVGVQCLWGNPPERRVYYILFRIASMSLAVNLADYCFRSGWIAEQGLDKAVLLVIVSLVFFVANTFPLAAAMAAADEQSTRVVWRERFFWYLPYYPIGAAIALISSIANRYLGWQTALLVVPVCYLIYRSYGFYLSRLEAERKHIEEMNVLHMRTIEALAMAIEAKDTTTHEHLQRVQIYAIEIAKDLKLNDAEIEALRAASVLHDIGKLAVPEHIISKPGRLTPEEFEKMKIHPVVGAEILERVQFPYPVAPIVRAHHEKWDGTGYPYGLAGNSIPIGARILSAVDTLDALASDRQYRRALPVDVAMQKISEESGRAFDPAVVAVLQRRYVELEKKAKAAQQDVDQQEHPAKLSTDIKIARGEAPAAGFETAAPVVSLGEEEDRLDFLRSIASARQEVLALFELSQDLGNSLSLDETLSVLAVRLRRLIPHHGMAIYMKRGDRLIPEYVTGDDYRLFSSLEIPIGQGLSGWVAENRKPILNGNPTVESGYLNDPKRFSTLRSAAAVPLEGLNGIVGVMALYHADANAFTKDHLRILLAISSKVALCIENALKYLQAETSATTDFLTGLPNARSLFLHLDTELQRCRRMNAPLTVLVLDLDDFKGINDRFGHLEGNKVLRHVARGLKEGCTEFDYVARMGGDEFVIVLPGVGQDSYMSRVERFRGAVAGATHDLSADELLKLSIGAAHLPEDGCDAEQVLAEADRRMYKEKQEHKYSYPSDNPAWSFDWRSTTAIQ